MLHTTDTQTPTIDGTPPQCNGAFGLPDTPFARAFPAAYTVQVRDPAGHLLRVAQPKQPAFEGLTGRQRTVAELAARGLCNKLIASRLGITEGTAKVHLTHAMAALDVERRTDLPARLIGVGRQDLLVGQPVAVPELTPRQCEVLRLAAAGMTNDEIASHLPHVTSPTVKIHLRDIGRRLKVSGRTAAVAVYVRHYAAQARG